MHRWLWLALVGCGRFGFAADDARDDGGGDALPDGEPPCTEPWSAPFVVLPPDVREPSIRGDGLEIYATDATDLMVSTRPSRSAAFSPPVVLPMPPSTPNPDFGPSISDDGLELFFAATVTSNAFTYRSLRATVTDPFGMPDMVGILGGVDISHDRLSLYGSDFMAPIRVYRRPSIAEPFGPPTDLAPVVNDPVTANGLPSISSDDLDLYFVRNPSGATEAWVAHRTSPSADFSTAERIDIPNFLSAPDISADGHFLYFVGSDYGLWAISRCE